MHIDTIIERFGDYHKQGILSGDRESMVDPERSPFHNAAVFGYTDLLDDLANNKSEIDLDDTLYWAAAFSNKETVRYLVEEMGADPRHLSDAGFSSLYAAAEHGNEETFGYLYDLGVEIYPSESPISALEISVYCENRFAVSQILDSDYELSAREACWLKNYPVLSSCE